MSNKILSIAKIIINLHSQEKKILIKKSLRAQIKTQFLDEDIDKKVLRQKIDRQFQQTY